MPQTRAMARRENYGHMSTRSGGHVSRYHQIVGHLSRYGHHYVNAGYQLSKRAYNYYKNHKKANNLEQQIRGDDTIQGISSDRLSVVAHPPLHRNWVPGSYCHTVDHYEASAATPSGAQNSFTILHLGSMYDVLGADAGSSPTGAFQLPISLHHVVPNVAMPAQAYYAANNDPLVQKFAIRHVQLQCDFVNPCNFPVVADLYFFQAKKNIPSTATSSSTYNLGDVVSIWGRSGQELSLGKGPQTFTSGYGAGNIGYQSISDPGAKPMDNMEFRKWYKLIGSHSMNLGAGAVEKVNVSLAMNMVCDVGKTIEASAQNPTTAALNQGIANYNTGLLKGGVQGFVVFRGTPVKDLTVGNSGHYTLAPAQLGCVITRKIAYSGIKSTQKDYPVLLAKDNLAYGIDSAQLEVMTNSNINAVPAKEVI